MPRKTKPRRGRPPSDDSMTGRITVRFPLADIDALKQLAEHNGESLSDVVRRLTTRQLRLVE